MASGIDRDLHGSQVATQALSLFAAALFEPAKTIAGTTQAETLGTAPAISARACLHLRCHGGVQVEAWRRPSKPPASSLSHSPSLPIPTVNSRRCLCPEDPRMCRAEPDLTKTEPTQSKRIRKPQANERAPALVVTWMEAEPPHFNSNPKHEKKTYCLESAGLGAKDQRRSSRKGRWCTRS